MNENMLAPRRSISACAHLTLPTGAAMELTGADVISFSVQEGADSPLLPGAVLSARLELTVSNPGGRWRDVPLTGATVGVSVICEGHELPCGVFIIDGVSAKENSGAIVLSGSDSIASELSGAFEDGLSYPATLDGLWRHLISKTRYVWSGALPGGGAAVAERPDWGSVTLRRAAGWIAQAAGCFVRVNRLGEIEPVSCAGGAVRSLGPDAYLSLDDGFESFGPVTGLRVIPKTGEAFGAGGDAGEILTVEGNPLFAADAASLAENMLSQLEGLRLEKASFRWRGEPSVGVGDRIALKDTYGSEKICTVTRQTMRFENGFFADCICGVPERSAGGVARAITPEGGVNADALVGTVDGGLLRADSVAARAIAAKAITAEKLAAGSVTADKLDAATVSGVTAQFVAAELEKLTAGDIDTDRLYAAAAHIVSLAAGSIAAGSVTADRLSAALARFVSVYAQTGEFDFATVENLVSGALSLQQGAMETVYIKNLAVTQANLLSATLGKLVLKGDDGGYWRIFVGSDGTISAEKASEAGGLPPGGQVVEAGMNVGSLNASSIQASAAVINSILTTALQAGSITAADALIASATIPELYTTTIRAIGESLELVAGRKNIIHRGETPPADAGAGDLWVQPSTGALFQMAAGGAGLPEFAIDEDGMLYYSYGEGRTVYQLTLDESGDLYVDEAAPFAIAIGPEGQIIPWERVKDGELQAGIDRNTADIGENKTAIGENTALIRQQSAKITEMADAIDLRVTTEVYEQGVDALGQRIQKNEASITLLDKSITSKVSQEVYDQDIGAVREDVTAIRQTAKDIRLEVSKKSATFRQSSAPTEYAEGDIWIDTDDSKAYIATASGWASWKPSELKTSFIEIAQDHIDVSTGGSLNVDSGAAHFRTKEYTLSILADDDSEETVMDFDAESKTLRVTEIAAGNARPYIAGITEVTSSQIGGLDGLAGLLAKNQYEHIVYTQETDDYSSALIEIRGSNSIVVEIIANTPTRVPSLRFYGITGNVLLRNLKWEMYSKDSAFVADSGVITMLNCYINAQYGILAEYGARVNWIGDDNTMTSAGKCTSAMAIANTCADIKLFGLIPSGYHLTYNGGTITSISTETGESIDDGIVEYTTETIEAEVGYYGTKNGWKSGQLYQGYSGGKGRIYGCMRFDLPSGAGNIQSAVLGLHRYKDAGKGSEVDVTLYGSAAAFGSQPSLGTKYLERADAAAPDATVSFDVTEAVRALANGTIKQLVLYTGETTVRSGKVYSSNYAMFDRAALKITY